jgi:hypothetical protein
MMLNSTYEQTKPNQTETTHQSYQASIRGRHLIDFAGSGDYLVEWQWRQTNWATQCCQ